MNPPHQKSGENAVRDKPTSSSTGFATKRDDDPVIPKTTNMTIICQLDEIPQRSLSFSIAAKILKLLNVPLI